MIKVLFVEDFNTSNSKGFSPGEKLPHESAADEGRRWRKDLFRRFFRSLYGTAPLIHR